MNNSSYVISAQFADLADKTQEIPSSKSEQYELDTWLRKLGLWRGAASRKPSDEERIVLLQKIDFSKPIIWQRSARASGCSQATTLTSHTAYDPVSGLLEDKIIYSAPPAHTQACLLQILALRDPKQQSGKVPRIVPQKVWLNNRLIFDGTLQGGSHDAESPAHVTLINRISGISRRVKERLIDPSASWQVVESELATADFF